MSVSARTGATAKSTLSLRRSKILTALVAGFVIVLTSQTALAQIALCSATVTPLAFGSVDPTSGLNADTTATLSVTCTGLGLTGPATVCVSVNQGSGGATSPATRTMLSGSNALLFGIYKDPAHLQPLGGPWSSVNDILPVTVNIPLLTPTTVTRTIYGRVPPQGGVAVGSFTSTLTASTTNALVNLGGNCTGLLTWAGTSSFNATAQVQKTCKLNVSDLDFGPRGILSATVDASTNLAVTCTAGTPYTIAIGPGLSGASDPTQRRMSKGGEWVRYGLYRDNARTLPWGWTTGSTTYGATGNGSSQSVPVYGRVPAQNTPSPGTYSDVVVITMTY